MKRLAAAIVVAQVLVWAHSALAQTPVEDSVTGSGDGGFSSCCFFGFRIDAHSGPSGETPTGTASFSPSQFGTFTGPVTCLHVDGNAATLNFVVIGDPSGPHVFTFTVIDSSSGDRFVSNVDKRAPTDCSPLDSAPDLIDPGGDIVVVDAQPLPIIKDECKNGGWRAFGVFKNQGDCVSFVATGGKNLPTKKPG
jgi:hypothetical protein